MPFRKTAGVRLFFFGLSKMLPVLSQLLQPPFEAGDVGHLRAALEPGSSPPRSSDIDFWFAPPDLLSIIHPTTLTESLISLLPDDCWNTKRLNAAYDWKKNAALPFTR